MIPKEHSGRQFELFRQEQEAQANASLKKNPKLQRFKLELIKGSLALAKIPIVVAGIFLSPFWLTGCFIGHNVGKQKDRQISKIENKEKDKTYQKKYERVGTDVGSLGLSYLCGKITDNEELIKEKIVKLKKF